MARDEVFTDHIARLCSEHDELDELLARVADGDVNLFATFEDALRDHIDREDNGLFPAAAIHLGGPEWDEVEQLTPAAGAHR
jgi:hemerythrin-like domain-containing protein